MKQLQKHHCTFCHRSFTGMIVGRRSTGLRQFCSRNCIEQFYKKLNREKTGIRHLGKLPKTKKRIQECLNCQKKVAATPGRRKKCSSCKAKEVEKQRLTQQKTRECVSCGGSFASARPRKTCSAACHERHRRQVNKKNAKQAAVRKELIAQGKAQWSEAELAYHQSITHGEVNRAVRDAYRRHIKRGYRLKQPEPIVRESVRCPVCNVEHTPIPGPLIGLHHGNNIRCCSASCRKEARRIQDRKHRHGSQWRRAKAYGVKRERIRRLTVFARDRWHCQNCGTETPKALKGTYEINAPELDHIIPLSRGGPHTMENVQLLCRRCNGDKGVTVWHEYVTYQ